MCPLSFILATLDFDNLSMCSFNIRGFKSGVAMLTELCESNKIMCSRTMVVLIILVRTNDELRKFNLIHEDYTFQAVSGMSNSGAGLLHWRPFGGTGYLWHKLLNLSIYV